MSSIRPLAIITVLTVACVFLYFKINETEPVLPADVAEWTMSAGLEIGGEPSAASPAPQFGSSPTAGTAAPAFGIPATGEAPAFNPNPTPQDGAALAANASLSAVEAKVEAEVAELEMPDLPPLPTLPPANADTLATTTTEAEPVSQAPPAAADALPAAVSVANTPVQAPQESLFAATRLAVQAALDRGELSQALLLLSDWYGDPSLTNSEASEVDSLLSQLAGSVIYSTQHRLEPPHMVQSGETIQEIAKQYNVPWKLLAKINGLALPANLRPGQQLKVVQGPFSALIDLSKQKITVMLQRRYAGQFDITVAQQSTVEEGHWQVDQKLITPGNAATLQASAPATTEDHSLILSNPTATSGQVAILQGSSGPVINAAVPQNRAIQIKAAGIDEVFDILSVGSRVVIRR